jgi:hypothetical protein
LSAQAPRPDASALAEDLAGLSLQDSADPDKVVGVYGRHSQPLYPTYDFNAERFSPDYDVNKSTAEWRLR